jgi:hypothetical protein
LHTSQADLGMLSLTLRLLWLLGTLLFEFQCPESAAKSFPKLRYEGAVSS